MGSVTCYSASRLLKLYPIKRYYATGATEKATSKCQNLEDVLQILAIYAYDNGSLQSMHNWKCYKKTIIHTSRMHYHQLQRLENYNKYE